MECDADKAGDVAIDMTGDVASDISLAAQFRVALISAQHLRLANQIQLYRQPIYQNKSFSPEVTIINYIPNYNLISIMLASQHHDTRIMDQYNFFHLYLGYEGLWLIYIYSVMI